MRTIRIYKTRRYTIVGLDQFPPASDPALRKERVRELARLCGVKPGTRIELKKLPSSYSRGGDAEWLGGLKARIRMKRFSYGDLAHELRHIAQAQQFKRKWEWNAEYDALSTSRPKFSSENSTYWSNPYEIDAREYELLADAIRAWTP